jgi:hypothetical protein
MPRSREGLIGYLRCLVAVRTAHHQAEDTLAFPHFQGMLSAPYELLTEQHRLLHPMLEEAGAAIEQVATDSGASGSVTRLNSVLRKIQELWHPHIAIEEEHFTIEKLAALMPPDDHRRLNRLFLEHMQQHTGPEYLILPFLLYNLSPDQRQFFAGPPEITGQLVPIVWKEKWAPM